ncbi:TIGR03757 family integrating conjugative element protein [Halorhodospira abdelmalekii]|uniref:TIGR03757 family integrating conjugative element protein n=1 Tax=Halorhodospira abdelmalekii TaxID=421629 RepID=UPI001903B26C|nr:TIGR03757 family integrating conjugative element protein [Halorhodospira abdelmalekii]MBK1734890.1 TIGR03757 family integrating conjugative element protein [Halorhodospira abdelmalekii]
MMRRCLPPLLLITLAPLVAWADQRIEVFVADEKTETKARQAASSQAAIYRVDQVQQRLRALESQLPDDPDEALDQARRSLNEAEKQRLEEALRAVALAVGLGIDQVPAVVIDRAAVVYGTTDPGEARQYLREAKDVP